jgi:hypothetical protein
MLWRIEPVAHVSLRIVLAHLSFVVVVRVLGFGLGIVGVEVGVLAF